MKRPRATVGEAEEMAGSPTDVPAPGQPAPAEAARGPRGQRPPHGSAVGHSALSQAGAAGSARRRGARARDGRLQASPSCSPSANPKLFRAGEGRRKEVQALE